MAASAQRKTGNMLGLVLAAPQEPTSDISHVVMISGLYWQGCDAGEWCECEVIEYNPRRALGRCEQRAMEVFARTDKEDVWIKYPGYLKYRNVQQTRARTRPRSSSPSLRREARAQRWR